MFLMKSMTASIRGLLLTAYDDNTGEERGELKNTPLILKGQGRIRLNNKAL